MHSNKINWTSVGAYLSGPAPLYRPRRVTLSRSEGSVALGREMLSAAKHDRAVTPLETRIIVLIYIIGPSRSPSNNYFISPYKYTSIVYHAILELHIQTNIPTNPIRNPGHSQLLLSQHTLVCHSGIW